MRKRAFKFLLFVAVLGVLFCYGCGVVYTNVQTPMPTINLQANAASQTKAGKATCYTYVWVCLLYTSPSPRDLSTSRMPSSA